MSMWSTSPADSGTVFAWGDLFTVFVPAGVATRDLEHAVEFLPASRGPDGAPAGDEREGTRAWLSVFGPLGGPLDAEATHAIQRFAGTVGVALPTESVAVVPKDGVLWARADFDGRRGGGWTAVAIAWNAHLALVLVSGAEADPEFAAALDALLGSWAPIDPVTQPLALGDEPGGDF